MNKFDATLAAENGQAASPQFLIRYAKEREVGALNALCRTSKRHWGYDDAFMEKAASELTIPSELVRKNQVMVAESKTSVLGVGGIERIGAKSVELSHLFVHPNSIGYGVGKALFSATAALATGLGAQMMTILSDPNAAGFYENMGATLVGEELSSSKTGRMLPLFHFSLTG
ncbi:MAG: GNAT family N-acetyltransferase [Pseudomonadota bacterium]